jgi:RNA-binding protein 4
MPTKLYIGNIPASVSSTELKELFEKYGKVLECDIIKDYAFVHMEDASKAKASIAALNDFNLKGNRIIVAISTAPHRNSGRSSRRGDSPRHQSRSSRNRDYPMMSSGRTGDYSSRGGGGGGPDRSYPSMRSSYMNARSRPYDSPYERQRMPPPPPPPMNYADPYSMRGGPIDPYSREDFYHQRAPPLPMADHYGRGPPMRYVVIRA